MRDHANHESRDGSLGVGTDHWEWGRTLSETTVEAVGGQWE